MPVPTARRLARAAILGAALLAGSTLTGCSTGSDVTLANVPAGLAVDPFLWQGAIDVLSANLPIAVADASTGRIETGWGGLRGGNPGEEFRTIVQIYPGELSANSVAVQLFRRVNGAPAGVRPEASVQIQEAIFLRARQIRASIDE